MSHQRQAFTLVEILVVIAIIAILISLLLPAINSSREAARRSMCAHNLAQLSVANSNYELAHGHFPAGVEDTAGPIVNKPKGYHHNWLGTLMPYLEEHLVYKHIDREVSVYDKKNLGVRAITVGACQCPSAVPSTDLAVSNYAGLQHDVEAPIDAHNHGVFFLNSKITRDDITDGCAYTLLIGEKLTADPLTDLGWLSGTSATLRNTGTPLNMTGPNPPGLVTALPKPDWYELYEHDFDGQAGTGTPDEANAETQESDENTDANVETSVESDKEQSTAEANSVAAAPNPALFVGGFGSMHTTGANFVFADGTVRFLSEGIQLGLLRQLGHRADGKLLNLADID